MGEVGAARRSVLLSHKREKRRNPSRLVGERKEPHRMGLAAPKVVREMCFLTMEMVQKAG